MEKEEQIDRLVAILAEIGFDQRKMDFYFNEHFGEGRLTYVQEHTFGNDKVRYEVDVARDAQSGLYHATGFAVSLDDGRSYTFKVDNDFSDINTREAYNLLSGRAVMKFYRVAGTDTFQSNWLALDEGHLRQLPDYDFMAILRSLPIRELQLDSTGPKLIYELISGDRAPILLMLKGVPVPAFVEAKPRAGTLGVYDAGGTEIDLKILKEKAIMQEKRKPNNRPRAIKRKPGKNRGRQL